MKFTDFAGLDAKMEQLMRSAQAGRIVHALLFSGPHGTGKRSMAELMARAVLCKGEGMRPCDVCDSCKKCLNGVHPDIHDVVPEKNTIKVGQIRELQDTMSLASYEGGMKIAIIERADCMNESAQNALLKTLENPTGDALFFLLTDSPGALLPTVVSRCLTVRFHCLAPETCAEVLMKRGVAHERAALLAALAQGSVGRALEIDADEGEMALREHVIDALESLSGPEKIDAASAEIGEVKDGGAAVLEMMELWARDLMRVQNGLAPMQVADGARLRASRLTGSALLKAVAQMRRQVAANVSWANALDTMFFQLVRK